MREDSEAGSRGSRKVIQMFLQRRIVQKNTEIKGVDSRCNPSSILNAKILCAARVVGETSLHLGIKYDGHIPRDSESLGHKFKTRSLEFAREIDGTKPLTSLRHRDSRVGGGKRRDFKPKGLSRVRSVSAENGIIAWIARDVGM